MKTVDSNWSVEYTYDNLEVSLGEFYSWEDVVKLIKGVKPGDSLTQVVIERR